MVQAAAARRAQSAKLQGARTSDLLDGVVGSGTVAGRDGLVPPFLAPAGERGSNMLTLCQEMDRAGKLDNPDRPLALATGQAGDVFLCHPFLVHAAQRHLGSVPRFIAQPPLDPDGILDLDRPDGAYSPVELAVRRALTGPDAQAITVARPASRLS